MLKLLSKVCREGQIIDRARPREHKLSLFFSLLNLTITILNQKDFLYDMKKGLILLVFFLLVNLVLAHGDEAEIVEEVTNRFLEDFLPSYIITAIIIFSAVPFLILYFTRKVTKQHIYFWIVIYLVSVITLVIVADTINLTINSETKGPVHWHADYQIWNCGKRLDIMEPEKLTNRIGTRLVHEHGDNRIHVEGIIKDIHNADLHNFFNVLGGELTETSFSMPSNDGIVTATDGELCNGEAAEVQIFAYIAENANPRQKSGFLVEQLKVNENYILSPYQDVPPGDCIIIEFDKRKEKTDKICDTYRIAVEQGRMVIV